MADTTYFTIEDWAEYYTEILKHMPQNPDVQKYAPVVAAFLILADRIKPPHD